jgi:hypothetical protein
MIAAVAVLAAVEVASAVSVVRGPYLQTPTETSMIVRWRTDAPTSSRVKIGAAPGSLTTSFDDGAAVTDHIVNVTGLTANTQYFYSVGSVAGAFVGDDADHYFRTDTVGLYDFRIWTIGDAGFPNATLDAVRDSFKAYNGGSSATDLFLLLGDNAYGSNLLANDANYQLSVFGEHADMLRTTPVYSTFGNHERFVSQDLTQTGDYFNMFSFPTAHEAGGVSSGTEAYYSFNFHGVHFIVLDSEDYASSAGAMTPMLTWLQADLVSVTPTQWWTIALWHRPPYSRGLLHNSDTETNEINMRENVLPILEDFGVDLVLSGHSHSYERSYLLDGHYGLANTFTDAFKKDLGDGDPAGDGSYRKESQFAGDPHSGAVYAVNGSGSEVRPATLDHPAHVRGLLEAGSMVIDVTRTMLTARFLSTAGAIDDQFQIVKGVDGCLNAPATGCNTAVRGRVTMRNGKWGWKWKSGTIDAADAGDPTGEADLRLCIYDQTGGLLGGDVLHGKPEWKAIKRGFLYRDKTASRHGFEKIKIRTGTPSLGALVQVKGRSALPTLPASLPVVAQLVNLDNGKCWSSEFATAKTNQADRFLAVIP